MIAYFQVIYILAQVIFSSVNFTLCASRSLLSSVLLVLLHFAFLVIAYSGVRLLSFAFVFSHIRAVVLNQMLFPHSLPSPRRGHRNFGYVTIVYWVETGDVVKHVAIHRALSITKNILAQIFNSAESGKSWFQIWFISVPHSPMHLAILLTLTWISG